MTIEILKTERKHSHLIKVTNNSGLTFHIPVIDVRDGNDERKIAKSFLKNKGSKFMRPSYAAYGDSYQSRGTAGVKKD